MGLEFTLGFPGWVQSSLIFEYATVNSVITPSFARYWSRHVIYFTQFDGFLGSFRHQRTMHTTVEITWNVWLYDWRHPTPYDQKYDHCYTHSFLIFNTDFPFHVIPFSKCNLLFNVKYIPLLFFLPIYTMETNETKIFKVTGYFWCFCRKVK